MKLTEKQIEKITAQGGSVWEKYGKRRIYINAEALMERAGWSWFLDHKNRKALQTPKGSVYGKHIAGVMAAKTYIDIETGRVYSDDAELLVAAQALLTEACTEEQEPEQEQEQDSEQEQETPCTVIAPAPIETHDAEIYGLTYRVPACSYPATPPF